MCLPPAANGFLLCPWCAVRRHGSFGSVAVLLRHGPIEDSSIALLWPQGFERHWNTPTKAQRVSENCLLLPTESAPGSKRAHSVALVHVGHGSRPIGVFGPQLGKFEAGCADKIVDFAVEVTSPGDVTPHRR